MTNLPPSPLSPLLRPRGIAIVGASADPTKMGSVMMHSLAPYAGTVVAVNERLATASEGRYPSVSAAVHATSSVVDLAVLCVPAAVAAPALERAADGGVRAALVCAGGFAESGPEGAAHQEALVRAARARGVRLLGPNTSGFFAPSHELFATFVPGARNIRPGRVGVVAASGGVNHALAFLLTDAGYGVSMGVGVGNGLDVQTADVVDYMADDADTTAIALHVESVTDGRRLLDAVRNAVRAKPVVALVVGRADVGAFAQSHTGALATTWRTTRAALSGAGVVLVDDERELVDAVGQLSCLRLPAAEDPGVALVTAQAGPGLLVLDNLRARGVRLPTLAPGTQDRLAALLPPTTFQENPIDTGRPSATFGEVIAAVADDHAVGLVAIYALTEPAAFDMVDAVSSAVRAGASVTVGAGGPAEEVGTVRDKLLGDGVAVHLQPTALAAGVRALVEDARARWRADVSQVQPPPLPEGLSALVDGVDAWTEDDAKSVLDAAGIRTPRRIVCASGSAAQAALRAVGGPVAVKILDAAVIHKTEIGGVHLGIDTPDAMASAWHALRAVGAERVLVEEMAPHGVDLIIGAGRDPVFGPIVLVGIGGTAAEAISDVAVRTAPTTPVEAGRMCGELLGAALLDGWRGGPRLDRDELARMLGVLAAILEEHSWIDEIEINPLRLTAEGLVALDALVATKES